MKFNKFKGLLMSAALTVSLLSIPFGQSVQAAQINNTSEKIQLSTKITKDNIYDVLQYLGIDSSGFIANDATASSVQTVGDLKDMISKAKGEKLSPNVVITNDTKNTSNTKITNTITPFSAGSMALYRTADVSSSYSLTFYVSGQFSGTQWTGVTSPSVSIDSHGAPFTYQIAPNASLIATWTPATITLKSYVTVNQYVGVVGVGLVATGVYQGVSSTTNWNASSYL